MGRAHVYEKLIAEKCVEDASKYIWLRLEARSVLISNRKVSNWIVFCEKSDSFLKCLWFSCDLWGFWWVERKLCLMVSEKCVEDTSEYIYYI